MKAEANVCVIRFFFLKCKCGARCEYQHLCSEVMLVYKNVNLRIPCLAQTEHLPKNAMSGITQQNIIAASLNTTEHDFSSTNSSVLVA